jgi:uncharacterized protein (TIRG00374 family)
VPVLAPRVADPSSVAPEPSARVLRRRKIVARARPVVSLLAVAAGVGIIVFLPHTTHTSWAHIGRTLERLSVLDVVGLTALWFLGLFCYSFVLTGALPGLKRRQALTLNLTGSSVANVAPMGGAAGVGLNSYMLNRWGFRAADIASFAMVTNLWNVLAKLTVSGVVLGVLLLGGLPIPLSAGRAHAVLISTIVAVILLAAMFSSTRLAAAVGRCLDAALAPVLGVLHVHRRLHLQRQLPAVRRRMLEVARTRWPAMSLGMVLYLSLQAALLWACLSLMGNHFALAAVLTAFAVDRLLTAVPLTPGGSGVVEAGTAAALIALGGAPAAVAAAVLLYRAFTFLIEIPVGGVWAAFWFAGQRRQGYGRTGTTQVELHPSASHSAGRQPRRVA